MYVKKGEESLYLKNEKILLNLLFSFSLIFKVSFGDVCPSIQTERMKQVASLLFCS